MAKGGVVDGQYWNNARSSIIPGFSSSETGIVSCSLGDDRVLVCNGYPTNILGTGLFAQTREDYGTVDTYTLRCDRAADGLLTCDPITSSQGIYSRGPFATCSENTLNYLEDPAASGCTMLDGLYLN
jgi:hypothetical protein